LREFIKALRFEGRVTFSEPVVDGVRSLPQGGFAIVGAPTQTAAFLSAVVELLVSRGPSLYFCERGRPDRVKGNDGAYRQRQTSVPPCSNLYLRRRVDQHFCSVNCLNREAQARYRRARAEERRGAAHRSYGVEKTAELRKSGAATAPKIARRKRTK
jgi:hypothetical protein